MDASVSLPDPGEFHHPLQNGHAPGLVVDDLATFDPVDPIHPTDVADMLAAPGLQLGPELVQQQTRILEEELRAELDQLDLEELAQEELDVELLLGFETLTRADLVRALSGRGNQVPEQQTPCPVWCDDADLPGHGDGFDSTPEAGVPHRGVPHDIPARHGGSGLDHAGRAEVSVQLEQDRDLDAGPVITLAVVVRGIEQYAWLTPAEARTLYRTLGQTLADATGHR